MVFRLQYASIQEEAPVAAKEREREILQRSINLMIKASAGGADPFTATEAVHFTVRIWTAFLEDLAKPDNQLPKEARAGLISIGIWILKELDGSRANATTDFASVIEISEIIRDGLQ